MAINMPAVSLRKDAKWVFPEKGEGEESILVDLQRCSG